MGAVLGRTLQYFRHPLSLGFLTVFWATPEMSFGHLLYASLMTLYVLVGIPPCRSCSASMRSSLSGPYDERSGSDAAGCW